MIDEVLLVAIVVILAAIAATFGFGLSDDIAQTMPQASVGISDHNDGYEAVAGTGIFAFEHTSGDDLAAADTRIVVRNQTTGNIVVDLDAGNGFSADSTNATINGPTTGFDGETLSSGDTLRINVNSAANPSLASGYTYEVFIIDTESNQLVAEARVDLV